jgi:hypothetical protein
MIEAENLSADEPLATTLSPFEIAKHRINLALKDILENGNPLQRSPCIIFEGCQFELIDTVEVEKLRTLFLHLCSVQDQRRWSIKSGYAAAKGLKAYRGVCSRSGTQAHKLLHRNVRTSLKCKCKASFTLFNDGKLIFKNAHHDLCLPDPDMGNDGYVFNSGLSPSKKSSMISQISDLLSDYGTTPSAARKQIENSLVKSGDTGFGSGEVHRFLICS